ncbi:MAG: hypothetical protein MJZ38_00585 [archaeon]|nr:hypothetical protein [archaeon]
MAESTFTFRSLQRFERCPHAYRLDQTEADRVSLPQEFLDTVVRNAAAALGRRRLNGRVIDKDTAMSVFWNTWDVQSGLQPPVPSAEKSELLKVGERCMANYVRLASRFCNDELVACDLRGEIQVPGGSVEVRIDEISSRGGVMVVTRYISEPGIRTKADLENDREMFLALRWARENVPGADRCLVQWKLLHPGFEIESEVPDFKVDAAVAEVGRTVSTIRASREFGQREGEHCALCSYRECCPRFTHGTSGDVGGRELVSQYAEFQEKIDALRQRMEMLEAQRDEVGRRLIDYADSHGYTALTDGTFKATVSHLKKAELPKEKSAVIRRLREIGRLEEMSTVNYSRLRADIVKGIADPDIIAMAVILDVDRVNLRRLK